jgi:hypothetical protein
MLRPHRRTLAVVPIAAAIVAGCGASSAGDTHSTAAATSAAGARTAATGTAGPAARAAGAVAGAGAVAVAGTTMLEVGSPASSPPVPSGFVGISTIFSGFEDSAGGAPSAIDPVFVQLLKNLAPGQRPVIRIGGDSTDWTWWPVAHMKQPGGIRFVLDKNWLAVARALAQAADARLILGVNFEANSRKVAAVEARALINGIGSSSVAALELGNEPELYDVFGWYHTKSGVKVLGRPLGWDQAKYLHDYASVAGALPHVPLAGPSVGGPAWIAQLPQFLHDERRVSLATIHAYPLKVCSASAHVTIPELLAAQSSAGLAAELAPAVNAAHRQRVPLRLDEMNAVSCGGQQGVSDTFATALWSVDFLFQLAKIGVSGVNINSVPGSINSPFSFLDGGNRPWTATVRPLYYGMQLFADAAPAGSQLLSVHGRTGTNLRTWATRATDGTLRVVLINDDITHPANVALTLPGASGARPASVELLRAPHIGSTSGVTLGGQRYAASTTTGTLVGTPTSTQLTPAHGKYRLQVPQATAALLTLAPH